MRQLMLVLVLSSLAAAANVVAVGDVLTVDDIEKTTGLTGVHTVPQSYAAGAGGELNFAGPDDQLVAIVFVQSAASMYPHWKKHYFKKQISGIGEEGFLSSSGGIYFKKGGKAISIQSSLGGRQLKEEELIKLAEIAASRVS